MPTSPADLVPPPAFSAASGPTGSFTLTLTASPSCAIVTDSISGRPLPFPESVQLRRYQAEFADGTATLKPIDGTNNQVHIGGIDRYVYYGRPLMTLTETELTIVVPPENPGGSFQVSTCAGGDYWWEWLSEAPADNEAFELCGTWRGSVKDPTRIEGTISGAFAYYRGVGPRWTTRLFCAGSDHRFALTKQ